MADVSEGVTMVFLVPGEVRFVARTNGQSESWRYFELILEVEEVLPGDRVATGLSEGHTELIENPEGKVGQGVTGTGAAERHAAAVGELAVQREIHLVQLVSPLQGMASADPGHRIAEVPIDVILRVGIGGR